MVKSAVNFCIQKFYIHLYAHIKTKNATNWALRKKQYVVWHSPSYFVTFGVFWHRVREKRIKTDCFPSVRKESRSKKWTWRLYWHSSGSNPFQSVAWQFPTSHHLFVRTMASEPPQNSKMDVKENQSQASKSSEHSLYILQNWMILN